jgi:uncharacterized membrane protein
MNRVAFNDLPRGGQRLPKLGQAVRATLFLLFLLQFALVYARLWQPTWLFGAAHWPEALLLLLTTATLLASLHAQLPGQNVLLAGVLIAGTGGLAHTVGALTGIPFGPLVFTQHAGQKLFEPLPWSVPLLWLVALLAARGTARLVVRPWRNTRNYGFWVLGLAVALGLLFELGLEPFATQVQGYWTWQPTKLKLDWYTTPCVNFLGWALVALLILGFITPALINKKPVQPPPQYQPLAVWLLGIALLATSAALHQFWTAFWVTALGAAAVALLAAYGALQPQKPL